MTLVRATILFRQLRLFHHVINSDEVFGTHRCFQVGLPQPRRIARKVDTPSEDGSDSRLTACVKRTVGRLGPGLVTGASE
jgi:hypothetical protein